ncbi:MAG: hypothetical protein ACI9BW_002971 [Gammaproteobacteria bacterium]|jgi:hypothetical protein
MTIQELGSLGELIAAIATVATLIYLASQLRQNSNQLKGDAIVAINNTEEALVEDLRDDEDLARAFINALNDWNSVTPQQQTRVHLYLHAYTRWCETCWLLSQRGALDDTTYSPREVSMVTILNPKGGREWWGTIKFVFDERFSSRIDQQLASATEKTPSVIRDIPFYRPEYWTMEK